VKPTHKQLVEGLLDAKSWSIEDVADEAIRQYERAERWKTVAEHALKSLNIYNDGDGDVRICVIDDQMLAALDEYTAAEAKEVKTNES